MHDDTLEEVFPWVNWSATEINHHHGCKSCERAKAWVLARCINSVRNNDNIVSGWLRKEYDWGPVQWPLHWCEIPDLKKLDCGVFAAITREYMQALGLDVYPVQFVLLYHQWNIRHWLKTWCEPNSSTWIHENAVYHEVVGVVNKRKGLFEIWDPTDTVWYGRSNDGFPSNLSKIRILGDSGQIFKIEKYGNFVSQKWHVIAQQVHPADVPKACTTDA